MADKFSKYAEQTTEQGAGLTEMFFGDDKKQIAYAAAIQNPQGPVYKALLAYYTKSEKPASFNLKIQAQPKQGAGWMLSVSPPELKSSISAALDAVYQKIVGGTMATRAQKANALAKQTEHLAMTQTDVGALEVS